MKMKLSKDDKFYEIKLSTSNAENNESVEAAEIFEKKPKRQRKKRTCYDYLQRQEETYRNDKIKSLIDFDDKYISSIKSLAVKKETKVNLTTRLLNGNMLMFFETSIQSFVYVMLMFLCYQMKKFRKFMTAMRSKNVSCIKT